MIARTLAKLTGTFHNISYYAPEMRSFADLGLRKYWRAYMAYRSAPMGIVAPAVVEATFYNFSPSRVRAGIPSAWTTTTPQAVLDRRDECITQALHRVFPDVDLDGVAEAAELALGPIQTCSVGARPLFGAHRDLPVPDDPLLRLWFGCTLWREHRGDGHNLALAAAGIDGIECHVLLAAKGIAGRDVIGQIRGWTEPEWDAALARLSERDLVHADGSFTEPGRQLRSDIETHTDALGAAPRDLLGDHDARRLIELIEPLVATLIESGTVPGRWPPPQPPR